MAKQDNLKAFISISGALNKWWLEEGLPPEKALALHDAADTEFFAPGDKQAERTALNLPNDRKIVLYSGSLYKDRNIMNVLKLAKMRTDALFVIVGGPSAQANAMKDKASSMGISNTLFTGPVKYAMVPSYLSAADILLMLWSSDVPTINYCSPLKVFEYMSTERIIVGHGFPTIREVLSDNKTAYLADPSSLEDLRAKLEEALANTDNSMASKARALVVSEYNWTLRCRRILDKVNSAQ